MPASPFALLSDLMAGWADDVLHGQPPTVWPAGPGPLAAFPLGPGLITVIGGPPGSGKTALANQLALDAVRLTADLKVLVTCCELPVPVLLDRQLSRLSGVPYAAVRGRALTADHRPAIDAALATLAAVAPRVAFHTGPFTLDAVAAAADGADADLIVIDYLQRLGTAGEHRDKRTQTNAVLDAARAFADAGRGLLFLSSVGRQPSGKHGRSSYDGLSLASFKESGDIEYAADDCFLLPPAEGGRTELRHVKARHTEQRSIPLRAELAVMRFDPDDDPAPDRSGLLDRAKRKWAAGGAKGDAG